MEHIKRETLKSHIGAMSFQELPWTLFTLTLSGTSEEQQLTGIAAQRMWGWRAEGLPFHWRLPASSSERSWRPAAESGDMEEFTAMDPRTRALVEFTDFAGNTPLCSFNLSSSLKHHLLPEFRNSRIGINHIPGFCIRRLCESLLDASFSSESVASIAERYGIANTDTAGRSDDIHTLVKLITTVLGPQALEYGLKTWDDVAACGMEHDCPTVIKFGKFKGMRYTDALGSAELYSWLRWLAKDSHPRSTALGTLYLQRLKCGEELPVSVEGSATSPRTGLDRPTNVNGTQALTSRVQELRSEDVEVPTASRIREDKKWVIDHKSIPVKCFYEDLGQGVSLPLIRIPEGEFFMGDPLENDEEWRSNSRPVHRVKVRGGLMGQTPITQLQWRIVASWPQVDTNLRPDPSSPVRMKGDHKPVVRVGWPDAIEFCKRLQARTGRAYSLPTEAQWEYACRAGTLTEFSVGEKLPSQLANYQTYICYADNPDGDRYRSTAVGTFPANPWGLYDMHGNVREWCLDDWRDDYKDSFADDRAWLIDAPESEKLKVLRGGSYHHHSKACSSSYRMSGKIGKWDIDSMTGFRVAIFN